MVKATGKFNEKRTKKFPFLTSFCSIVLLATLLITMFSNIWNIPQMKDGNKRNGDGDDTFQLANTQSYGFFKDIPDNHWNLLREIASSREEHRFVNKHASYVVGSKSLHPPVDKKIATAWFQSHYEPNFSCQFRKRIGGNGLGDGPKWVCDPHRLIEISNDRKKRNPNKPGCLIYSVGSAGNFQFEESLQRTLGKDTCEVHIFDFGNYESKMPKGLNLHYHMWGLGSTSMTDEKGHVFKSFNDTMTELGHNDSPAIDIFKIDCEGCEFRTYTDWLDESTPMFQQILVEVHGNTPDQMKNFFDAFTQAGYVRFSKEHNAQLPDLPMYEYGFLKVKKEFWIPNVVDPGVLNMG